MKRYIDIPLLTATAIVTALLFGLVSLTGMAADQDVENTEAELKKQDIVETAAANWLRHRLAR